MNTLSLWNPLNASKRNDIVQKYTECGIRALLEDEDLIEFLKTTTFVCGLCTKVLPIRFVCTNIFRVVCEPQTYLIESDMFVCGDCGPYFRSRRICSTLDDTMYYDSFLLNTKSAYTILQEITFFLWFLTGDFKREWKVFRSTQWIQLYSITYCTVSQINKNSILDVVSCTFLHIFCHTSRHGDGRVASYCCFSE